jgi:hypothetical protein
MFTAETLRGAEGGAEKKPAILCETSALPLRLCGEWL